MRGFALLALWACKRELPPEEVDADRDGATADIDCDDDDPQVRPGILEQPYDGVDNDCDPSTADDDLDGDGLIRAEDCDDRDPGRPTVEVPYDGVDNDCDPSSLDDDLDGDGFPLGPDCDDVAPDVYPGAAEVYYDGVDNDCDPFTTADDDQDHDGVGVDEDCDDDDPFARAPLAWFVDCDGDGLAASDVGAASACASPPPPATCPDGGWTLTVPVDPDLDCADGDPDAYGGQTSYFEEPVTGTGGWDYDCDGAESSMFGGWSCEVVPGAIPNTFVCLHTDGWEVVPECGGTAPFSSGCTQLGNGPADCEAASVADLTRACR